MPNENPYETPATAAKTGSPQETQPSHAEHVRRELLKHEASIKSIGVLYVLAAAAWLILSVTATFIDDGSALSDRTVAACVGSGIAVLCFWTGFGLWRLRSWAKIPVAIFSTLGLLAFPIGTFINGYILYLVFSYKGHKVFRDDYKKIIEATPQIRYKPSIIVWFFVGLLLFVLAFVALAMLASLALPQ